VPLTGKALEKYGKDGKVEYDEAEGMEKEGWEEE
jgi:hypothetical protein